MTSAAGKKGDYRWLMERTVTSFKRSTAAPAKAERHLSVNQMSRARLQLLNGWKQERNSICKTYQFKNFHQTIAFVNAVAWISHREGHHPDLSVSFNSCQVSYTTHSIVGLSENDFICATKVDALIAG
jgi:4a-hydroxytetrahydrobiopterin dehydratase